MSKKQKKEEPIWNYEAVPTAAIRLFKLVWQLENWLRTIVYVELRAERVDWEEPIKTQLVNKKWPPYTVATDKKLHHMATHHQVNLSYLSFSELWSIIDNNWSFFEPYFPIQTNTRTKIEEFKTIRNRVAHFREPHTDDESRLELFLKDMDKGLRNFCYRYTCAITPKKDPVIKRLQESWEGIGYGYEMKTTPTGGWLYAPAPHTTNPCTRSRIDFNSSGLI